MLIAEAEREQNRAQLRLLQAVCTGMTGGDTYKQATDLLEAEIDEFTDD